MTGGQCCNELDSFRVRLFGLDDVGNEAIESLDGMSIEQGVEVSRESSPVMGCPSVSGGYQNSVETVEGGGELA